jgi:hypothetical protein
VDPLTSTLPAALVTRLGRPQHSPLAGPFLFRERGATSALIWCRTDEEWDAHRPQRSPRGAGAGLCAAWSTDLPSGEQVRASLQHPLERPALMVLKPDLADRVLPGRPICRHPSSIGSTLGQMPDRRPEHDVLSRLGSHSQSSRRSARVGKPLELSGGLHPPTTTWSMGRRLWAVGQFNCGRVLHWNVDGQRRIFQAWNLFTEPVSAERFIGALRLEWPTAKAAASIARSVVPSWKLGTRNACQATVWWLVP